MLSDRALELRSEVLERMTGEIPITNAFDDYIKEKRLHLKRTVFKKLSLDSFPDFPILTTLELKKLMLGEYQLSQAISYISEHMKEDEFPLKACTSEKNILQIEIRSRHKSAKYYKILIKYEPNGMGEKSITGWSCTCPNGLRTIGSCVHICAVILYLSNTKYNSNQFHPAKKLTELFLSGVVVLNEDSEEE